MKKFAFILMAAAALFTACNKEENPQGGGNTPGGNLSVKADFTISANPCFVGDEITFTATATGGAEPYTYTWTIGTDINLEGQEVKYTFEKNNAYIVKLTVVDSQGNKAEKRKNLVVNPAVIAEKGDVTLLWAAYTRGYNAVSSPAVADDGSVYAVSGANADNPGMLYKFDKDGKQLWAKELGGQAKGTPSIDTDGTVFIGNGSTNGTAAVFAFNPDGSKKWEFTSDKFWAAPGATLAASMQAGICGIGSKNIYFGNCGTTGSVLAADKATGARVGWVTNADGTGGPAGGVRSGVVITKNGQIVWGGGKYGTHFIAQSKLDGAGNAGVAYDNRYYPIQAKNNTEGGIAVLTINGKTCIAGLWTSNDTGLPWIYAFDVATGEGVCNFLIEDTPDMDNGAIVVTKEGYLVGTLNFSNGQENGGIIVVDPSTADGRKVAEYRVQEKVSGSPAIDAAGNIHFGTESGNYYVVDKDCNLIAKRDLKELVLGDSRYTEAIPFTDAAKVYSSVVIGDDGKVYIQFTNNDAAKKREFGAIACLQIPECKGVSDSVWPMFGQNRRHTNNQK